jgi:hypothetical protein
VPLVVTVATDGVSLPNPLATGEVDPFENVAVAVACAPLPNDGVATVIVSEVSVTPDGASCDR